MTLTTEYLSFWTRIKKELLGGLLIICLITLYSYFSDNDYFRLYLGILGFGIFYLAISVINAWTFVNTIDITDNKVIVTGTHINSWWKKEFETKNSEIKIKSRGKGRGNVEYYLRLSSSDQSVDIHWNPSNLLTFFHEFKRLKGEK